MSAEGTSSNQQDNDDDEDRLDAQAFFVSLANWDKEAKKSFEKAKKHFNRFCAMISSAASQALFGNDADYPMCYDPSPDPPKKKGVKNVKLGVKVLDAFALYLVTATPLNLNNANKLKFLAMNSADRYLSALKTGTIRETSVRDHPWKNREETARVRNGMIKALVKRNVLLKQPNTKPHTEATEQDLIVLALICILADNEDMSCFASFTSTLFQLAGRGGEVAYSDWDSIKLATIPEFHGEKLVQFSVNRLKTLLDQDLVIFPHAKHFLLDWNFLRAYSMIMDTTPNEHIFRQFHDKTKKVEVPELPDFDPTQSPEEAQKMLSERITQMVLEQSQGPITEEGCSAVADGVRATPGSKTKSSSGAKKSKGKVDKSEQQVSKLWKKMCSMAQKLVDSFDGTWDSDKAGVDVRLELTSGLSSHSAKKFAVNSANDSPGVQTRWLIDRCGWVWNAMHTLFDYLTASHSNDRQVGRALSGWTSTRDGVLSGGRPPRLQAIRVIRATAQKEMDSKSAEEDNVGEEEDGKPNALEQISDEEREGDFAKSKVVAKHLFQRYEEYETGMSPGDRQYFHELLFASILMYLEPLMRLLLSHPQSKFGSTPRELFQKNTFLAKLGHMASMYGVSAEKLRRWGLQVRYDFLQRNGEYVPFDVFQELPNGVERLADTRTLQNQVNSIGQQAHEAAVGVANLAVSMTVLNNRVLGMDNQMERTVRSIVREELGMFEKRLEATILRLIAGQQGRLMMQTDRVPLADGSIQQHDQNASTASIQPPSPVPATVLFPSRVAGVKVRDFFVQWYEWSLFRVYPRVQAPAGKQTKRSVFKLAVELFTLFTPYHVPKLANQRDDFGKWRKELVSLADSGWNTFLTFYQEYPLARRAPELVEPFNEYMGRFVEHWPMGPSGSIDESFQIASEGHKVERMKGREKLVLHFQQKARKRQDRKQKEAEGGGTKRQKGRKTQ